MRKPALRMAPLSGRSPGSRSRAWRWWPAIAAGCFAAAAGAADVTLTGERFNLRYDAAQVGLLGAPALVGDQIVFTPALFQAESLDGAGNVINDQQFAMLLLPHPGQRIDAIAFTEQGLFRLAGAQSDVNVRGSLEADFMATGAAPLADFIRAAGFFSPNDGAAQAWAASAALDLSGRSDADQAAGVSLLLLNGLQGFTRPTDVGLRIASIETAGPLLLSVSVVPEPATWGLMMLGLLPLAGVAARRRA